MTSKASEKAALVGGVTTTTSTDGTLGILYRGTCAASSANFAINIALRGKWLNIFSASTNVQYGFATGTSARTLVYDQDVTPYTGSNAAGGTVPAGTITPIIVPMDATFISFISAGTTGKLEMYVSELPAV